MKIPEEIRQQTWAAIQQIARDRGWDNAKLGQLALSLAEADGEVAFRLLRRCWAEESMEAAGDCIDQDRENYHVDETLDE